MRVSISATGSVRLILTRSPYQLALRTPGISPFKASSRKQIRQRPNFLRTARDRPQRWQRRTPRTLNFGVRLALSIQAVFAMLSNPLRCLAPERPSELSHEPHGQVIPVGGRHHRDVHPVNLFDSIEVDLREDHLLLDPEGVIPSAIEAPVRKPAEVANARHRKIDEAIEELVHPGASKCHRSPDRHAGAEPEIGNRLLGLGDHCLLPGDQAKLLDRSIELLGVLARVAHANVEDDLYQLGDLVRISKTELLGQPRPDRLLVVLLQPGRALDGLGRVVDRSSRSLVLALSTGRPASTARGFAGTGGLYRCPAAPLPRVPAFFRFVSHLPVPRDRLVRLD